MSLSTGWSPEQIVYLKDFRELLVLGGPLVKDTGMRLRALIRVLSTGLTVTQLGRLCEGTLGRDYGLGWLTLGGMEVRKGGGPLGCLVNVSYVTIVRLPQRRANNTDVGAYLCEGTKDSNPFCCGPYECLSWNKQGKGRMCFVVGLICCG